MATDVPPTWLGSAITATIAIIGAIWAFLRYMFVTRREMERYIEKVEGRFESKVDEIKDVLIGLHADNKNARHNLRNDLNAPITNLAKGFEALRQELVRQRQHDMHYRRQQRGAPREAQGQGEDDEAGA